MALRKVGSTPVLEATIPVPAAATPIVIKRERTAVEGQVAMHAIITGYKVASQLAATLAASPEAVRTELHKLAGEVATKIEEYTFGGDK